MALFRRIKRCLHSLGLSVTYLVALTGLLVVTSHLRNQVTVALSDSLVTGSSEDDEGKMPIVENINGAMQTKRRTEFNGPSFKYTGIGYQRAEFLNDICMNDSRFAGQRDDEGQVRVSYDASHNALFCPLCKMASTFWTRVFVMLAKNRGKSTGELVKTPFDVPISQAPASKQYLDLMSWKVGSVNVRDSFRFLFIRDPYAMLFSAYVDKIVGPNPHFWSKFSRYCPRKSNVCGSDLTFSEFLLSIISLNKKHGALDCHVAKYSGCNPCGARYTYVAKMETFKEDTFHILEKLGQNQTLEIFQSNFSAYHAEDAIDDSVNGPFKWKKEITRCISWPDALRRVWRKLQIRGAIGTAKFPLTDEEAEKISKSEFKRIIQTVRLKSSSQERSDLKRLSFAEAYQSVPFAILYEIRKIYWKDFVLFDYNNTPDDLFIRDNSNHRVYGFLNYSSTNEDINLTQ